MPKISIVVYIPPKISIVVYVPTEEGKKGIGAILRPDLEWPKPSVGEYIDVGLPRQHLRVSRVAHYPSGLTEPGDFIEVACEATEAQVKSLLASGWDTYEDWQ